MLYPETGGIGIYFVPVCLQQASVCKECAWRSYWFPPLVKLSASIWIINFLRQLCVLGAKKRTWFAQGGGNLDNQLCAMCIHFVHNFPTLVHRAGVQQRARSACARSWFPHLDGGTLASGRPTVTYCSAPRPRNHHWQELPVCSGI